MQTAARSHKRGFGLTEILIAAAAVAALATLVASMLGQFNIGSLNAKSRGSASDLEAKYRAAFQDRRALANSRAASAALNNCFTDCNAVYGALNPKPPTTSVANPVSSNTTVPPFELRSAANEILVPGSGTAKVNDASQPCTTGNDCHWIATAQFAPLDAGANTIRLFVTLRWDPTTAQGDQQKIKIAPRTFDLDVPRTSFNAPSGSLSCASGEYVKGFNSDGTPQCQSLTKVAFACETKNYSFCNSAYVGNANDGGWGITAGCASLPKAPSAELSCSPGNTGITCNYSAYDVNDTSVVSGHNHEVLNNGFGMGAFNADRSKCTLNLADGGMSWITLILVCCHLSETP